MNSDSFHFIGREISSPLTSKMKRFDMSKPTKVNLHNCIASLTVLNIERNKIDGLSTSDQKCEVLQNMEKIIQHHFGC